MKKRREEEKSELGQNQERKTPSEQVLRITGGERGQNAVVRSSIFSRGLPTKAVTAPAGTRVDAVQDRKRKERPADIAHPPSLLSTAPFCRGIVSYSSVDHPMIWKRECADKAKIIEQTSRAAM